MSETQAFLIQASGGESTPRRLLIEIVIGLIAILPFTILFYVYTSDIEYYESPLCVSLLDSAKTYNFWVLLIGGLLVVGILPILILIAVENKMTALETVLIVLRFAIVIAFFVFFIFLCIAYGEDEPCGGLRTLTLVYIILAGIGFGIGVCACCCFCCLGGMFLGLKAGSQSQGSQ